MGRHAGYIALWCGIANGAEDILLPEYHVDDYEQKIVENIKEKKMLGKKHHIIINAEGVGDSYEMAKRIERATGMETRATIVGHIQRGGSPTIKDRVVAAQMGMRAIDILSEGKSNRVVVIKNGRLSDMDIDEGLSMTKSIDEADYNLVGCLSRGADLKTNKMCKE
jgi:6-phosphofructokinase 1